MQTVDWRVGEGRCRRRECQTGISPLQLGKSIFTARRGPAPFRTINNGYENIYYTVGADMDTNFVPVEGHGAAKISSSIFFNFEIRMASSSQVFPLVKSNYSSSSSSSSEDDSFGALIRHDQDEFYKIMNSTRPKMVNCAIDHYDEYIKIGESTAIKCLKAFCNAIVAVYTEEYMCPPNEADIAWLLEEGEQRGFPGMLGSIDCMHWERKNCPGSHNDINVLDYSSVFNGIVNGQLPPVNYVVNGHHYVMGYYLSDGIYPKWTTLMQTIPHSTTTKEKLFAQRQEATRKDMERAFRVLQIK
ncbi:uncharacterized protein LOC132314385 [Cornus florida]|uniref:uncharacterized protein LOC132314385 n=1 Tax=Cornus florida TaxID=4283 RepID=UPI0028A09E4D|nr:uncharacterized protein LOC132314385 [Cornus florida]